MKKIHKQLIGYILTALVTAGALFCTRSVPLQASSANALDMAALESEMEVHFLDVGQGDATLIKCGGQSMLIDAGDDSKGTAIQNYLQKQGIKKLDYLILTHPDADHIGGAPVIITKFDIDKVFMSNFDKDTKAYRKLIEALDYKRLKYETPAVGAQYALGAAQITVLAPNRQYDNSNDSSIALTVKNGANAFLFTGDAEENAENDILSNNIDISADVYHAGHHGSKSSTSEAFFKAVNPEYAVISCGEGNDYGHPHAQTLNVLRANGVKTYRTDEQGSIIAISDGKIIKWSCSPSETWIAGEPAKSAANNTNTVNKPSANTVTNNASYICNKNTKKFHYPYCSSVGDMSEKNKLPVTMAREEVIAQGYVPCKRCNP